MTRNVQLHGKVLPITRERIRQIAETQKCQQGAVIDKAMEAYWKAEIDREVEYHQSLKNGESITLPPSGV